MADLLQESSAWLDGRRRKFLARAVIYRRGQAEAEVPATVGRTTFEAADDDGVVQRWESRDFLILAADLADFGLPQPGDRITETDGGRAFVYEVMALPGQPARRYGDPYRRTLRVHTKQVGTA